MCYKLNHLVRDLAAAMAESPSAYEAEVVRVNARSAPAVQRVLVEMRGPWKQLLSGGALAAAGVDVDVRAAVRRPNGN